MAVKGLLCRDVIYIVTVLFSISRHKMLLFCVMCIEILHSFDDAVRLYVVNEVLQHVHRLGRDVMKGYRVITHPFVALQRNIHNIFIKVLMVDSEQNSV